MHIHCWLMQSGTRCLLADSSLTLALLSPSVLQDAQFEGVPIHHIESVETGFSTKELIGRRSKTVMCCMSVEDQEFGTDTRQDREYQGHITTLSRKMNSHTHARFASSLSREVCVPLLPPSDRRSHARLRGRDACPLSGVVGPSPLAGDAHRLLRGVPLRRRPVQGARVDPEGA